jgi:lipoyl(octanoyl) transferase
MGVNQEHPTSPLRIEHLGRLAYAEAFDRQRRVHEEVQAGGPERLLLVEHLDVITLPDRPAYQRHVLVSPLQRRRLGIDLQITDRGGDVTYHGPGQFVAYPIIRLRNHGLNLGRYMRLLEAVVIATLARFGIRGVRRQGATGVWNEACCWEPRTRQRIIRPAKICAMGVRIRKGVTLHGLALNVTTNLSRFESIVPCGLAEREVTSMARILGPETPSLERVGHSLAEILTQQLQAAGSSDA